MQRLFKPMNERTLRVCWIVPVACVLMASACADSTTSVSVRGYNHMNRLSIHAFDVNSTAGPNVSPESGGGETCCVSIPERWKPGLKARVAWEYDQDEGSTQPLPKNQVAEVEIPEYRRVGAVQVHFYEGHRIKVIVSPCSPEHPFYPLGGKDLAPWTPSGSKENMREAAKRGGGSVDC
jgi:hypothetical protein